MYETNAILRRPPRANSAQPMGGGNQNAATAGAASTAEIDVLNDNNVTSYVLMRFDGDCYVRFGPSGLTAATASDWPVKAGEIWEWLCVGARDRYMRVIRAGATDVNIDWYLTDRPPT